VEPLGDSIFSNFIIREGCILRQGFSYHSSVTNAVCFIQYRVQHILHIQLGLHLNVHTWVSLKIGIRGGASAALIFCRHVNTVSVAKAL
jgi:hypothetical protein